MRTLLLLAMLGGCGGEEGEGGLCPHFSENTITQDCYEAAVRTCECCPPDRESTRDELCGTAQGYTGELSSGECYAWAERECVEIDCAALPPIWGECWNALDP